MAMIQSDVDSTDGRLAVKFYKRPIKQEFASQEQGRPIFEEQIYIRILVPGDGLSEIDRPMYNEDKSRFPKQWYDFQNRNGGEEMITGTLLSAWPSLSTAQVEELKALKFYTVEQIANASDQQLGRVGMIAGMSPYSFRDKAKSFLNLAKDSADEAKREQELAQLREENDKIKAETEAKLAKMQEQMTNLLAAVGERKPRGKKPKETVEE